MVFRKITVLMAAMLGAAILLAAGLTVLPSSVQDAQANQCSNNAQSIQASEAGDLENEIECEFENIGSLVIIETGGLTEAPFILPTP
jgi:hypothetical protein